MTTSDVDLPNRSHGFAADAFAIIAANSEETHEVAPGLFAHTFTAARPQVSMPTSAGPIGVFTPGEQVTYPTWLLVYLVALAGIGIGLALGIIVGILSLLLGAWPA